MTREQGAQAYPSALNLFPNTPRITTSRDGADTRAPGHPSSSAGTNGSESSPSLFTVKPQVLDACSVALRRLGDSDVSSIGVTSSTAKQGRTTVAEGFALTGSRDLGRDTLLIDLDSRPEGTAEAQLAARPGLGELIRGQKRLDDCLEHSGRRLSILRIGGPDSLESSGIEIGQLEDFIAPLMERWEFIVADLPHLDSGPVAPRLADLFQTVVLVLRAGEVTGPELARASTLLPRTPLVMLNTQPASRKGWLKGLRASRRA